MCLRPGPLISRSWVPVQIVSFPFTIHEHLYLFTFVFSVTVTCNLVTLNDPESVRVQGTKGEIVVRGPPARPTALIIRRRKEGSREFEDDYVLDFPIQGKVE